jgi:hypothetical protein
LLPIYQNVSDVQPFATSVAPKARLPRLGMHVAMISFANVNAENIINHNYSALKMSG